MQKDDSAVSFFACLCIYAILLLLLFVFLPLYEVELLLVNVDVIVLGSADFEMNLLLNQKSESSLVPWISNGTSFGLLLLDKKVRHLLRLNKDS